MTGLMHIYHGDGKGKTTAAVGLAVRALGSGMTVRFCQFLKSGDSCEVGLLRGYCDSHALTLACDGTVGFVLGMGDDERRQLAMRQRELLQGGFAMDEGLLVLDELLDAVNLGLVELPWLVAMLEGRPSGLEVVLTGRNPAPELVELADYVTELRKVKHPYDSGKPARRGIEY